jgi:hypothetical protein
MTTSAAAAAPSARGPWPPGVSTTTWQSHAAAHCRRPSRIASERRRGPAGVGTIRAGCPSGVHAQAAASVGAPSKMVRSCSWDGTRGGRPAPPLRGRGVRPVRNAWRTGAGPGACHTEAAWGPAHQVVCPPGGRPAPGFQIDENRVKRSRQMDSKGGLAHASLPLDHRENCHGAYRTACGPRAARAGRTSCTGSAVCTGGAACTACPGCTVNTVTAVRSGRPFTGC